MAVKNVSNILIPLQKVDSIFLGAYTRGKIYKVQDVVDKSVVVIDDRGNVQKVELGHPQFKIIFNTKGI